ncbi:MAG TPA: hypothetical protein VKG78_03280 [Opitutaceae bacterium]|nr:hypothetical protein [Opitutaceae bacterium]
MRKITGISLSFFLKVGLAASIFILLAKFISKKVNIPGLSNAAQAL